VIARDENHFFAMSCTAQNLLDNRILHSGPLYATPHRPEIDNVTNEKKVIAFEFPQEINKPVSLATSRTQMDV
jgi:hypothetical protein